MLYQSSQRLQQFCQQYSIEYICSSIQYVIKSRPKIEASVHDRTQLWTMLPLLVFVSLISFAKSVPLEPGQPGGPWTEEEIDIVREKVNVVFVFNCRDTLMSRMAP